MATWASRDYILRVVTPAGRVFKYSVQSTPAIRYMLNLPQTRPWSSSSRTYRW